MKIISGLKFTTLNNANEANFLYKAMSELFGEITIPIGLQNFINQGTLQNFS